MPMVRVLLALLLLPLAFVLPATTAVQAHPRGAEHCIAHTPDEMELIILRKQPKSYALIEKRMQQGECGVHIVDNCKHGWCPVRQGPFDGWIQAKFLKPVSAPVYCVARVDRGWTLDLHAVPSRSSRVIISVNHDFCGIAVTPNRVGHWVEVKVGQAYGWVSASSLR